MMMMILFFVSVVALLISTATPAAAATPRTFPVTDAAQSFCYSSSAADQVIDCYSTLPSGQDASYQQLSQVFCDHMDDTTVTDMRTGLMWTKQVYGPMSLAQASSSSEDFSAGGHDDWRLPSIKELYTLMDFNGVTGTTEEENTPYINAVFNVQYGSERHIDGQVWSSNQYVSQVMLNPQECQFGLNFIDGRIKCYPISRQQQPNELFVRYVRGTPQTIGVNAFTADDDSIGIVTDTATGLQWTQQDSGEDTLTWPEALEYCESLSLGGFDDWRLPDAHELHSIVDYTRSPDTTDSPAIDDIFSSTPIVNEAGQRDFAWYWTSDTHLDGRQPFAVYVAFGRAMGLFSNSPNQPAGPTDVHGAGAQRSDPKIPLPGTPDAPQGDYFRVYNMARCVRGISSASPDAPAECDGTLVGDLGTPAPTTVAPTTTGAPPTQNPSNTTQVPSMKPSIKESAHPMGVLPTGDPTTTSPTRSPTTTTTMAPTILTSGTGPTSLAPTAAPMGVMSSPPPTSSPINDKSSLEPTPVETDSPSPAVTTSSPANATILPTPAPTFNHTSGEEDSSAPPTGVPSVSPTGQHSPTTTPTTEKVVPDPPTSLPTATIPSSTGRARLHCLFVLATSVSIILESTIIIGWY